MIAKKMDDGHYEALQNILHKLQNKWCTLYHLLIKKYSLKCSQYLKICKMIQCWVLKKIIK